jgi:hypothetical protein
MYPKVPIGGICSFERVYLLQINSSELFNLMVANKISNTEI